MREVQAVAIFHLSVKIIGRGQGRSAVGAISYRAGVKIRNEYDGRTHDYTNRRRILRSAAYRSGEQLNEHDFTHKGEVVYSEIMLPEHAPKSYQDRMTLWNSVEKREYQKNARLAREVEIALPNELTREQQIKLVQKYVQKNFVSKGMCADFSIHAGHIHERKDEAYPFQDLAIQKENPHVHIMLTVRPINEDGSWGAKSKKEYILDKNGNRIKSKNGEYRSNNIKLVNWGETKTLIEWRKNWANTVNREFERLGINERIDHRTLKAQGIDRTPTKHMGHENWNLENRGIKTRIGNENREIMAQNKALEREAMPEATADKLHELKEAYIVADCKTFEIEQKVAEIKREKDVAHTKINAIIDRAKLIDTYRKQAETLRAERQKTGILRSKQGIDEQIHSVQRKQEQATRQFQQSFRIKPEQAQAEIKRLETAVAEMSRKQEQLQASLPAMVFDRDSFKAEYYKRRLLADISRDRQRILDRFEQLENEMSNRNLSPKERLARMRSESSLKMTEQEYTAILQELPPNQQEAVIKMREREKELERIRDRDRGR